MRFLTEEQLVRKAVIEGLGRALCEVYTEEQVGPPTEDITRLLARPSDDQPINVAFGSFISEARPSDPRALRAVSLDPGISPPQSLKASSISLVAVA